MTDWWLDEAPFAGAEHLDPQYVAGYDAKAQFDPAPDVELLRRHGLGPGATVVDLGAGTGTFALAAAAVGATVTAVDVSPAMLASMRDRFARSPDPARLVAVGAGFLSYDHVGEPADIVFTRNALHQLPDLWKVLALRRIAGIVRPGGVLRLHDLVLDLEPDGVEAAIGDWLAGAAGDPDRGYTARELADHLTGEFSTFSWLLEPMLDRTGFEILDRRCRRGVYAAYTCRRRP